MLSFILGGLAILLGAKAFTQNGLPLTRTKNLTGKTAKVIGVACILLGVVFLVDGVLSTKNIITLLRSDRARPDAPPMAGNPSDQTVLNELNMPVATPGLDPSRSTDAWDPALDVAKDAFDETSSDNELAGKWEILSGEIAGRPMTVKGFYEFKNNQLRMVEGSMNHERTFEMDPYSQPNRLDSRQTLSVGVTVLRAIYRIDGDVLIISDSTPFHARPDRFVEKTTVENDLSLCRLTRVHEK